jgi:4-amino-4-deoxy-L-arabinose transferase-like glycosyltransferase
VAILAAAPWYLFIAREAKGTLVQQFLWTEILSRIVEAPHGHTGPPGYYLLISLAGLLPWTAFIPGCVLAAFAGRHDRRFKLLLIWLSLPWIVLEAIRSKLPHYIMPCYVPLAILLAAQLSAAWDRRTPLKTASLGERRVLNLWAQVMVIFGLGLIVAAFVLNTRAIRLPLIAMGCLLAVAFLLAASALRRTTTARGFGVAAIGTIAFHGMLGLWALPSLEPMRLSREVAREVNARAEPSMPVYICGYEEPTMFFYLKSVPVCVETHEELVERLKQLKTEAIVAVAEQPVQSTSRHRASSISWKQPPTTITGLNYVKMDRPIVRVGMVSP